MIAVTIGCGRRYSILADFAAARVRAMTGLETHIIGDDSLRRWGLSKPHQLKLRLFHEFPEAESILYFDADLLFLQRWNPNVFANSPEIICVSDLWNASWIRADAGRLGVPVRNYFNSGFFIVSARHHASWLEGSYQQLGMLFTPFYDQSYLNHTRWHWGLPARFLPKHWNFIGYENHPRPEEIVIAHLQHVKRLDLAKLPSYLESLVAPGEDRAAPDPLPLAQFSAGAEWMPRASYTPVTPVTPMPKTSSSTSTDQDQWHADQLDEVAARDFPYPSERFAGRGIIVPGGGPKYFPSAWVCINMLRRQGCTLPIEVWHLGEQEMDDEMRALLAPLGAVAVDAREVAKKHPVRRLNGWELKAFALLHCPFREVLLLDADNVAVADPTYLFDTPEYRRLGAIFWPDYRRLGPDRAIWRITRIPHRDEPEIESGQIVIDKSRCWKALNVAMHLNEHSDFYYRHVHGDKETFHFGWLKIGQEYAMPPHRILALERTMCQHDFQGNRLFQHRNLAKWLVGGRNRPVPGFLYEKECLEYLRLLPSREEWLEPLVQHWRSAERTSEEKALAKQLIAQRYEYHRVGYDKRPIVFDFDGRVGEGAAQLELFWDVRTVDGAPRVEVHSGQARTFAVTRHEDGIWRGQWEVYEKMPIELLPLGPAHDDAV